MKRVMLSLAMVGGLAAITRAAEPPTKPAEAPMSQADADKALKPYLEPMKAEAGDNDLRKKLIDSHNTAVRLLALRIEAYRKGTGDANSAFEAAKYVADAKMTLARSDEEKTAAAKQLVEVTKVVEKRLEQQFQAGLGSEANYLRAKLTRENAEIQLMQLSAPRGEGSTTQPK
jgi:hypothetical protein